MTCIDLCQFTVSFQGIPNSTASHSRLHVVITIHKCLMLKTCTRLHNTKATHLNRFWNSHPYSKPNYWLTGDSIQFWPEHNDIRLEPDGNPINWRLGFEVAPVLFSRNQRWQYGHKITLCNTYLGIVLCLDYMKRANLLGKWQVNVTKKDLFRLTANDSPRKPL